MRRLIRTATSTLLTITLLSIGLIVSPVRADDPADQIITLAITGSSPEVKLARVDARQARVFDTVAVGSWLDGNDIPDVPSLTQGRYKAMDAGSTSTCAIAQQDGHIVCWGLNDFGQANSLKGRYVSLSMGQYHGCAIHANGSLACWGLPDAMPQGQQGRGRYRSVSSGDDHTCAIRKDKTLECWGDNSFGELNVPMGTFQSLSTRSNHSCAVSTDQQLVCWGEEDFTAYTPASGVFTQVSTGVLHGCALRAENGQAICWGNNAYGQTTPPVSDSFTKLVSGDYHTCGLRADDTAICWGRNQSGQTDLPISDYQEIAAGGAQSCGLTREDGKMHCVGSYVHNPMLFEKSVAASPRNGRTAPQFAWSVFMPGLTTVMNAAFGNSMELLFKGGMSKGEKAGKLAGIGFAVLGFILGQTLPGDDKPDPYLPLLEDIQSRVKELQAGLNTVALEVKSAKNTLDNLSCASSVETLSEASNYVMSKTVGSNQYGPAYDMQKLLEKYSTLLVYREQRNQLAYSQALNELFKSVNTFKNSWTRGLNNLQKHNDLVTESLLGSAAGGVSPLDACKAKSRNKWLTSKPYPFDDRPIWEESYKVLTSARATQATIATLSSQLVGFDLLAATIGPVLDSNGSVVADSTPPITDYDINQDQAQSICDNALMQKASSSRWNRVSNVCDAIKQDTRLRYVEQVRIAEKMGGAYSDANVVLSLTAQQMGAPDSAVSGSKEENWLWVRDPRVGDFRESCNGRCSKYAADANRSPFEGELQFESSKTLGNLYFVDLDAEGNKSYGAGVWHSDGKAWDDVFFAREIMRKEWRLDATYEDVLERMDAEPSRVEVDCKKNKEGNCEITKTRDEIGNLIDKEVAGMEKPLFKNIKNVPFWYVESRPNYDGGAYSTMPCKAAPGGSGRNGPGLINIGHKFLASGVNKAGPLNSNGKPTGPHWYHPSTDGGTTADESKRDYLKLSGRVSTLEEVAAFLVSAHGNMNERDCNDYGQCIAKNDCNDDGECVGFGFGMFDADSFKPYKNSYWNTSNETPKYLSRWNYDWTRAQRWYNGVSVAKYTHFPVLNISKRKCMNSALAENWKDVQSYNDAPQFTTRRIGYRTVDTVNIPSICGADLDEFIKQMMTRPDPAYLDIPEVRIIP